ncbi:hypothetical protein L227DRAFT_278959 [Lentinus tigrinus ALCF2SS1-6]|uniref:Uncharacterized protein n=1 Tax=Lentinus tigrinus ALCF2SS1-6 TaxID=1328759 RepID=A0A5C2SMR4_9APHY|nr:hypothetical protein L227DRAFT_278959 [Lentinus tigrinus ALCF2SS1-6]
MSEWARSRAPCAWKRSAVPSRESAINTSILSTSCMDAYGARLNQEPNNPERKALCISQWENRYDYNPRGDPVVDLTARKMSYVLVSRHERRRRHAGQWAVDSRRKRRRMD